MVEIHNKYMRRCITLAKKGEGYVAPNPMVGAVIVFEGKIIGEGYHQKFGDVHAEVNAINSVKDKTLLSKSTIYVSLEPCAHHGKTPPCSDLIVLHKIPNVIIGSKDTFSKVNGKGIERLKKNGTNVVTGILESECRDLNRRFFTFHERKRPFIVLKWAQTKDGFIDKKRIEGETGINWISAPETRSLVHLWRSHEMGIVIGRKTAETDNPQLNVRDIVGENPIRIILDAQLSLEKLYTSEKYPAKTIVINAVKSEKNKFIEYLKLPNLEITNILKALWELNIQSILVEGGANTLQQFIISNTWDEIRIIEGQGLFYEGVKAPTVNRLPNNKINFGKDKIYVYQK